MRILYHHRTLGDGAEGIHVAEMVGALRRLGHDVRVFALIGEATNGKGTAQRRWSAVAKALPGFLYELGEMAYNVTGYLALSRAVREFRPDIIYDRYVSYHYSAIAVGRRHGVPVLLEVNSPYSFQKQTFDERLYFRRLLRLVERKTCADASQVIVVSTPLKRFLVSIGVPEGRVVVMPNGADPEGFHPGIDGGPVRARLGLERRVVVGFTGILRPWHGLDLLVTAFTTVAREHPNLHLLIVGDGPVRAEIERLVSESALSGRVTITGRVPHAEVRTLVAAMDVAVSPRATFYASPMKILEYMALGKPVVAPDMENIRDIIADGREGLLFRPEDPASLAEKIRMLVESQALRAALGAAGRRKIETERTWGHNARAVVEIARRLGAGGGGAGDLGERTGARTAPARPSQGGA